MKLINSSKWPDKIDLSGALLGKLLYQSYLNHGPLYIKMGFCVGFNSNFAAICSIFSVSLSVF